MLNLRSTYQAESVSLQLFLNKQPDNIPTNTNCESKLLNPADLQRLQSDKGNAETTKKNRDTVPSPTTYPFTPAVQTNPEHSVNNSIAPLLSCRPKVVKQTNSVNAPPVNSQCLIKEGDHIRNMNTDVSNTATATVQETATMATPQVSNTPLPESAEIQFLAREVEELDAKLKVTKEGPMERMLMEMRVDLKKDNLKVLRRLEDVAKKTDTLTTDVTMLKLSKGNVELKIKNIETKQQSEATRIDTVANDVDYLYDQVRILNGIVQKQNQVNFLKKSQEEQEQLRGMSDKLLISGLDEVNEETATSTAELVTDFFSQTMKIERGIPLQKAIRIGKANPRMVLVQLRNSTDRADVFKHSKNLKDVRNNNDKGIYINSQLPPQLQEQKRWYRYLMCYNANLASGKLNLKIKKGNLMIDDYPFMPAVQVPSISETMFPTNEANVEAIKLNKGQVQRRGGCNFYGYSAEVRNIADIRAAYIKVARLNSEALSISCAYRLPGVDIVHLRGVVDDNEHGAGMALYSLLEDNDIMNRAIFVARHYGNRHLGPIRFQLIKDAARSAMERSSFNKVSQEHQLLQKPDEEISFKMPGNKPIPGYASAASPRAISDQHDRQANTELE